MRSKPRWSTSSSARPCSATASVITPCGAHLGEVAHAAQQAVGDARRAARAAGDLDGARRLDRHVELQRPSGARSRPAPRRVEVEPQADAEAVAQRRGEQPGARRRADQRERLQVELDRARRRPLPDHDVDLVVLHRRVEDLLDDAVEAVDLVDEEDVAGLEVGEHRRQIARPLDHRAGGRADADPHLARDDVGERGLAEPGRAVEQRCGRGSRRGRAPPRWRRAGWPSPIPGRCSRRALAGAAPSRGVASSSATSPVTSRCVGSWSSVIRSASAARRRITLGELRRPRSRAPRARRARLRAGR